MGFFWNYPDFYPRLFDKIPWDGKSHKKVTSGHAQFVFRSLAPPGGLVSKILPQNQVFFSDFWDELGLPILICQSQTHQIRCFTLCSHLTPVSNFMIPIYSSTSVPFISELLQHNLIPFVGVCLSLWADKSPPTIKH